MIINMVGGGGSGGVSLEVVGGSAQPSSPKENMIWLNTETPIGAVCFSAGQPLTAANGDVWIAECKPFSTAIDIGGKNTMIFYISKCYQYDSEKFVEIPGQIYKGGVWEGIYDYRLFVPGDDKAITTGGWITQAMKSTSDSGASAKDTPIEHTEQYMSVDTSSAGTYGSCVLRTVLPVDLTGFKSLVFEGDFTRGGAESAARNLAFCVWTSIPTYYFPQSNKTVMPSYTCVTGTTATQIIVNVEEVDTACYIVCGATYSVAKITNCYLIPKE